MAIALAFMAASCEECEEPTGGSGHIEFDVVLYNEDQTTPIHMFALNETCPCCQVGSQSARSVHITKVSPGTSVAFSVGRNGVKFTSAQNSCLADDDTDKVVTWIPDSPGSDGGFLDCGGGWGAPPAAARP